MAGFKSDIKWLPILRQQEEALRFHDFTREDALLIGLRIVQLAREKYGGSVAVRVTEDDTVVFSHKMAGASLENDTWITRKTNVCKATRVSSLRAFMEIVCGLREETWKGRESAYIACGGCMPVFMESGDTFAYIAVSGLEHYLDHQVIAEAVAERLGVCIGPVE